MYNLFSILLCIYLHKVPDWSSTTAHKAIESDWHLNNSGHCERNIPSETSGSTLIIPDTEMLDWVLGVQKISLLSVEKDLGKTLKWKFWYIFSQELIQIITSKRVTGRKARGLQMAEIGCKCQTFLSLLSSRRKQTNNTFFLLCTNSKGFS